MATDALEARRASSFPAASQVFIAACRAVEASKRAELLLVSAIVGGAWRSARLTTVISDLFPIFELQECTTATRLAAAALGFAAS